MSFPVLNKDYDHLFKILIIGNSGVGKSNLLLRFSEGSFQESFQPTIGVDFKIKTMTWEKKLIKLQLWDTAGQERFRTITSSYYKGAHAVLVVFDVTNRNSFNDVQLWIEDLDKHSSGKANIAKIIVGNKIDLEENRKVITQEGMKYADTYKIPYVETSAKRSQNVDEAFLQIIKEAIRLQSDKDVFNKIDKRMSLKEIDTIMISGPEENSEKKELQKKQGSCC